VTRHPRFLVIRIVGLGDIAIATALLSRILAEHPGAHVTWLCGERSAPLVRMFAGVAEVLTLDEKRLLRGSFVQRLGTVLGIWRALAGRRFDRVLLAHADRRYRLLTWPLLGSRVASLEHGVNPLPGRFWGDEYARLLDESNRGPIVTRFPLADVRSRLPTPRAPRQPRHRTVVMVPAGARNVLRESAVRRWPAENYAEVARRLLDDGCEVVLVGDENDVHVRPMFAGLHVIDRIGSLSLTESLCILRDADVVVTHDTGPLHLARLVRARVVALFGPTDPGQVVGRDDDVEVLWGGADLPCRPCYDGREFAPCTNNLCMKDISIEAVMRAISKSLAKTSPEAAGSPQPRPLATI
jgi:heptosyltransferase II